MLKDDNNRRAYYNHVKKFDPTFYSKDYDTFSKNVLSSLEQYTTQREKQPMQQLTKVQK